MAKIIPIFIFLIALFFRIWNLSNYPVSLSMDEVAFGYNAYSLLETARDEFGEFLPLAFRSAGDYKPPVDFYLMVPFVAIFGLTELTIRLPIAILGALTVLVFIYLLRQLKFGAVASNLGGLWLAVSPWHLYYSRGGVGSISALFFLILGLYLFLLWVNEKKTIYPILSGITFSLSVWAYHAERVFVPLLVLFLLFTYKKEIFKKAKDYRKRLFVFILTVLIFAVPFVKLTVFSPAISERAISTSIFREGSLINSMHRDGYSSLGEKVFDNNGYIVFRHWLGKYLNYFDLRFWFWKGLQLTPPGYPDSGLLFVIDLPLFFIGVYALSKSKKQILKHLSLFWFFAGPLSASLTMNEQHPLRALVWLPFFGLIIASSFEFIVNRFKTSIVTLAYVLLILFNLVYFFDIYINQFPRHFSEYWQYGYKDVSIYACQNLDKYDEVIISDTFGSDGPLNTGLPYLYVLYFCDKDRINYINTGKHLDKLQFRRARIEDFKMDKKKRLIIGSPWDFVGSLSGKGNIIRRTYFLNGKEAFWFVEN